MKKNKLSYWNIMNPVKGQINFALILSVLSVIFGIITLLLIANILNELISHHSLAWAYLLTVVFTTLLTYIFRLISFQQSHLASFRLESILRTKLMDKIAKVSLGFLSDKSSGTLSKILKNDVASLHAFVADSTPMYARAYVSPLLTLVVLFFLDWRMALVAFAVVAGGMFILSFAMRNGQVMQQQYNDAREQMESSVVEYTQAMLVVRTFDTGKSSFARYQKALDNYAKVITDWYRQSGLAARLSFVILNPMPTLVALIGFGLYWYYNGSLELSVWIAILLVGTGMAEAIMPYMMLYNMIERAKTAVTRIEELLNAEVLPVPVKSQNPQDASIEFENVSFTYPDRTEAALAELSFKIPVNNFTALVGSSGSGKTTVAKLIVRFWDVNSGKVKIGNCDVRDLTSEGLMNQVAFVLQDNFLFSFSIADNIRLGLPNKTDAEVIAAAKEAQIHDFILSLPNGYDTLVGERGVLLSGGQKQRITVARAFLQNRPILILDEATSFSDAENEFLLMQALANLIKGRTVLMIAHRLSTIQQADQILVLDKGKLVESGKHKELLVNSRYYKQLWNAYQLAQSWKINTQPASINQGGSSHV